MNIIRLQGLEFHAHHGFYSHEKNIRQQFLVNLDISINFMEAAKNDKISGTINYEKVYKICRLVMNDPVDLIEHVAYNIHKNIIQNFPQIEHLKVEIQKRDVQLGGKIDYVSVILDESS